MISQEIRRKFLDYFKKQGHAVIPSSPVVPHDDPTLLFINAGMNQFKDVFLGKSQRSYNKATTSQKCIRVGGKHNDLDNVGHTSRHLTFFEMLGNFSFGDYFKKQAIQYAFEVTTEVFGFSTDDLWITVFEDDDEAFELWRAHMPEKRIVRMGEKDNFWAMGDTGPCGPCSELYFDRGSKYGNGTSPKDDPTGERYLEFWNLVFMQFNRDASGTMTPLPKQSIDTGAGLERVISLKMGVDSVFGTDILRSLIAEVEQISGKKYVESNKAAFHVIADHIRSLSFAIADGVQPSNVDRGYVLRKLLRRAVRYGRLLEMQEPFLARVLPRLVSIMGPDYQELVASEARIAEILTGEEEAFLRTLKRGGNILSSIVDQAEKRPNKQISGEEAFKLKDTYGFPVEEILLIAKDAHLEVNLDAYELLENQAKEKSRAAKQTHSQMAEENVFKEYAPNLFMGYEKTEMPSIVKALLVDGKSVKQLEAGEEALVVLDRTPFYAEKGGQVADTGVLFHPHTRFVVSGCKSPYTDVIVHTGTLENGTLKVGDSVTALVDHERRQRIANHHTATHLLHWALQKVLGEHIKQAGSLVEPDRLRFDFNHHKPLSAQDLRMIEDLVNDKIREDKEVKSYELSYDEAQKHPDIKQFFGDKYGSKVRVIDIDYSKELCGGTHTHHVGTIGYFRIAKESSIAAGVRRIEAICGKAAEEFVRHQEELALQKQAQLAEEIKHLSSQLKIARRASLKDLAKTLAEKVEQVNSTPLLTAVVDVASDELPHLAEDVGHILRSFVLVLAMKGSDKCQLLVKVSPDLVEKGVQAVNIIKAIAPAIGGSGGGKADSAQAGGKNSDGIADAFEQAKHLIQKL